MRVLVVPKDFPSEAHPQAGIFIQRRLEALAQLGYEFSVLRIVPAAPPLGRWNRYAKIPAFERVAGFEVHTIRAIIPPRLLGIEYVPFQVQRALLREIARVRPQIVHASFLVPNGHAVTRQNAVPTVVTAHGIDVHSWPDRRPGIRRACIETLRRATRLTAVSGFLRDRMQAMVPRDVDVVWNGGDERYFFPRDRAEVRAQLELPADRAIVVFVGALIRPKGVFELIEAARSLPRKPLLLFAGDGEERENLEALARSTNVEARFLGALPPEQVGRLYGAADVVTLPSYHEGLPNVVCEAMLSGRAVVASTAGGIPEIVSDGKTGMLVPARSAPALAAALNTVLEDAALRERLGKSAREFALAHLTWRISAQGYDRIYRQVAPGPY